MSTQLSFSDLTAIFYREAYRNSLGRKVKANLTWRDALEFAVWHIDADQTTRDTYGHTPAGQQADALIKSGLDHNWITRKSRGQYELDAAKIENELVLK